MLRAGFVGTQPREAPHYANFVRRMAELGYQEGRNFSITFRSWMSKATTETIASSRRAKSTCSWRFERAGRDKGRTNRSLHRTKNEVRPAAGGAHGRPLALPGARGAGTAN